jgi:hypothetical protein
LKNFIEIFIYYKIINMQIHTHRIGKPLWNMRIYNTYTLGSRGLWANAKDDEREKAGFCGLQKTRPYSLFPSFASSNKTKLSQKED